MKLYSYCRSSASYRVRIVLNLKQVEHQIECVNIVAGEQIEKAYVRKNTQGLVPSLELDSGEVLTQSVAIIEFLDNIYPTPRLIPIEELVRAEVRSLSNVITNEIQPLNNLRILNYLTDTANFTKDQIRNWYHTWIRSGFEAIEKKIGKPFCFGKDITLADCCLIPQVYNAHRFKFDMLAFPKIEAVYRHCLELEAFQAAAPESQPDFSALV